METTFWEWLANPEVTHYLIVSALLFSLGLLAVITRRNVIMILMGIELMLNAANINFLAFTRFATHSMDGNLVTLFIIILAAAEAAVALAIVLNLYNRYKTVNVDEINFLKG